MSVEHRLPDGQVRPARRVLVVDDHASFRRCASELLQAEGFDVVGEADDGASALARAAELLPRSSCSTSSFRTSTASRSLSGCSR